MWCSIDHARQYNLNPQCILFLNHAINLNFSYHREQHRRCLSRQVQSFILQNDLITLCLGKQDFMKLWYKSYYESNRNISVKIVFICVTMIRFTRYISLKQFNFRKKNYFKRHLATALSWFLYLQNTENRKYNQEASIIFTFLKTYPHISKLYVHINAYIWWKVHTLNQHEKSIILFGFSLSLLSV